MKDKSVLIFDADKRFEYIRKYLTENGFRAVAASVFDEDILLSAVGCFEGIVLPLPVSRDAATLNFGRVKKPVALEALADAVGRNTAVLGGKVSEEVRRIFARRDVSVTDYYDNDFIYKNAELTARALFMLFENKGIDVVGKNILITGFGRTAKELVKQCDVRGLSYTVAARSQSAQNSAEREGISFVKLENFTDVLPQTDIVINTVPALIFRSTELGALKKNAVFADIASAPFGASEQTAAEMGVRLIRALSLPGKYLPAEAGALIGKRVLTYLRR